MQKRLNVYKRNEKYQFWGYHEQISKALERPFTPSEVAKDCKDKSSHLLISKKSGQNIEFEQKTRLSRSTIKCKSNQILIDKKHTYDRIQPNLCGSLNLDIKQINNRLKTYQDEILQRDKTIRDLSVDKVQLEFKYRHQSVEN